MPDIDRLLEEGLSCYGAGDLEGALGAWEQVLAIDPAHVQANSYIGYVRENYDTLLKNRPQKPSKPPFPILDQPEYEMEVSPGELAPHGTPLGAPDKTEDDSDYELELEAEEPSFGGATSEYQGTGGDTATVRAGQPGEGDFQLEEATSSFHAESTPVGFASQETDVRKRELGFVQPSQPSQLAGPDPAEVQVRLRTPQVAPGAAAGQEQDIDGRTPKGRPSKLNLGSAPTVELEAGRTARDRDDLISSLPRPTPASGAAPGAATKTTRDLPARSRPPAPSRPPIDPTAVSQAEVVLQHAPTRDLERDAMPAIEPADPRAATRELGLRAQARAATSDDAPTREADVRAFRQQHSAREQATAQTARDLPRVRPKPAAAADPDPVEARESAEAPAAEPMDERCAQILAEVDANAPASESPDDRTRRRISGLLDRALAWNGLEDYEKAVTAVELALSEDPASALAQKLAHRNRDTVMTVFQNYLGPLDRQPQLARPLHELASTSISPRAAFLMSRIDGTLSLDEILDVSGMPRLEAYRHLCQLFLRGILK